MTESENKIPAEDIKASEMEIQSETNTLNNIKEDADNKVSATKKPRTTKKTISKTDDNEAIGDVKPKKKRKRTPKPSPVEEAKKAAEEEAKRIAEEYAKKPEEEIQKEAEEAFMNLIRIAIDEASYFGGSELKLRKDGQVEIKRSRRTAKPLTPDKERGTNRINKRIFDRDGYPVDSVEEAMEHYYEQFPEKVKNKRKSKAKTKDEDTANEDKTKLDKDKVNENSVESKDAANTENSADSKSTTTESDIKNDKSAAETKSGEASKDAKNAKSSSKKKTTKGKKKGKGKEDEKEPIQYNFLAELREYAMRERRKRLLKKYTIKKIDEDKDAAFFEVPKEIYQNPKAETCELEEIVCIRLYDDPYIQMTIDFNLNANVKKPRKKSSII